jgi:hypothetical protein
MIHDLNNILVTQRILDSWLGYLDFAVKELQAKFSDLKSSEIPDEQFEDYGDGTGRIFVTVRGKKLSLNVPKGEWDLKK